MYKITLFILLTYVLLLSGCNTTNSDNTPVSIGIEFVFQDQKGENLLNPEHPNTISEQNTDLYFLEDGEKKKVFKGNLDCPKMFCIRKLDDTAPHEYLMDLYPNVISRENTAITYIQFSDASMDTIKIAYEGNPATYVNKVWYNQELRWSAEQDGEENPTRFIVVTKNIE